MSRLLENGKIGSLELKNRIVMPPMCMYKSDESGEIKDFHNFHYVARAIGGVGFIIVEATAVEPRGRITNQDLGLWSDEHIKNHTLLNEKLHSFGVKTAIQIAHAGRKSECTNSTPIAPSSLAFSENSPYKMPQSATLTDIEDIKNKFLQSAIRAKKANYDAIELHAAHGYLLYEFLSPLTNKRDDIYGGSLENRVRLVLEITKSIKENVDLPLLVRLSASEWMKNGWNIDDSIYLCQELEKLGVDAIDVSSGGNHLSPDDMPNLVAFYQCDWAKNIKENINVPVIAVGLITTPKEGEYLIENGFCDFVAYGRELLRNPNLPFFVAKEFGKKGTINSSYLRAF